MRLQQVIEPLASPRGWCAPAPGSRPPAGAPPPAKKTLAHLPVAAPAAGPVPLRRPTAMALAHWPSAEHAVEVGDAWRPGQPAGTEPALIVFSGGTAFNSVAAQLRHLTTRVVHVLPVSDDGGSTAEIVRVLGGPAVGDIRSRCLRLADDSDEEASAQLALAWSGLPRAAAAREGACMRAGRPARQPSSGSHRKRAARCQCGRARGSVVGARRLWRYGGCWRTACPRAAPPAPSRSGTRSWRGSTLSGRQAPPGGRPATAAPRGLLGSPAPQRAGCTRGRL
jgi:hypothetical protein